MYLCTPPLLFGRRPPQSNCPPDTVPHPDYGVGLEFRHNKGGIPTSAPGNLTTSFQCLPPILYNKRQNPIRGCSKGSRGLSVVLRERGIFTTTSISPSFSLRQCPNRYAIRAGRNLPDKELRYLRTVIVTAAVYRGFSYELRLRRD